MPMFQNKSDGGSRRSIKKITQLLSSLLGIAVLLGLLSMSYTYPLTLGKISILYSDYGKFYHSQRLMLEGKNIYSPLYFIKNKTTSKKGHELLAKPSANSNDVIRLAGNLNPPFFTLITFPFAYFSYPQALLLWTFFSILAACLSVLLIEQKLDPPSLYSLPACLLLLIAFISYFPSFSALQFGQVTLLLLPLLALGWRAAHEQKSISAAIFLALAASVKPFIALFALYFLIRKEWRALGVFVLVGLLCALIAAAVFGINTYSAYYQACHQIAWAASNWNVSLYGVLLRLIGGTEANIPLIPLQHLFIPVYLFVSGVLVCALGWFLRPMDGVDQQKKTDLDFSLILVGMLLLSPLGWMYYFPFLSIPFLVFWNLAKKGFYPLVLPLLLATLLLLSNIPIALTPTNAIKASNALSVFMGSLLYFAVLMGSLSLLFVIRRRLKKPSPSNFESISPSLLLLIYAVMFLPSILGMTKSCNNWLRHSAREGAEYTLVSYQETSPRANPIHR